MPILNIYIVEDNPLLARVLKHFLAGNGYNICGSATTYEKAVRDLALMKVDLVISDIMLESTRTGIDLGRHINQSLGIPFIFQSSVSDSEVINTALNLKPIAYLPKPVNRTDLLNAISKTFSNAYCPRSLN